ncbi:MAG: GNAT family N-acetyltransferase [Anaerolineales bacterium]|jgi:ribosomal protein S18 acetylase RimI-like enzyme
MSSISLICETPEVDEYLALRDAAGLSSKTLQSAHKGLPGTLFAVCVREGDRLIGMGRVVGDGGCSFQIVDIAVHPDHQRKGWGTQIMEAIMGYLRDAAPSSSTVTLMADSGAPALYRKFGFKLTAPESVGMVLRM